MFATLSLVFYWIGHEFTFTLQSDKVKNENYSLYLKYFLHAYPWNSAKVVHVRELQRQFLACKQYQR